MKIGLDIGSTTIKCVVLDENDNLIYKAYERHYSHIVEKAAEVLARLDKEICKGEKALLSISGSAGMGLATACDVPFVQEVFAKMCIRDRFHPVSGENGRHLPRIHRHRPCHGTAGQRGQGAVLPAQTRAVLPCGNLLRRGERSFR